MDDLDQLYNDEIICPYCKYQFQDSYECFTDYEQCKEIDCDECGNTFTACSNITINYNSYKKKEI